VYFGQPSNFDRTNVFSMPGINERPGAQALQIGTELGDVDSDPAELGEHLFAICAVTGDRTAHAAVLAECQQSFLGHRIDSVGRPQRNVHRYTRDDRVLDGRRSLLRTGIFMNKLLRPAFFCSRWASATVALAS
jgi:hypothetical protein